MSGQYVGIDLHRRRSVIVHKNETGEVLSVRRIDNDPVNLARVGFNLQIGDVLHLGTDYVTPRQGRRSVAHHT